MNAMLESTRDALLGGLVVYEQPARGYRVTLEAPLLARFAIEGRSRAFRTVVDLGSGPGAVVLCLAMTGWGDELAAVELDEGHARLARANVAANGLAGRVTIIEDDVARVVAPRASLVIANPPWFEPDSGAIAADPSRAGARAFTRGTLTAFVGCARRLLAPRGRVVISMPSSRLVETLVELARVGLHPKRMRLLHPRDGEEADVVFLEAKPGRRGGLLIDRPWYVRGCGEAYTAETADALQGRWPTAAGETGRSSSEPASEPDPE